MIRTSGVLDKEHRDAVRKYSSSQIGVRMARLVLFIILAWLTYELAHFFTELQSFRLLMIISCITFIYFIFCVIKWILAPYKRKKPLPCGDPAVEHFFDDEDFGFVSRLSFGKFERHKRYESIHKAVEWNGWFFIYLNATEVCVIKNDELTDSTPDELRELLRDKLGERFSVQK